MALSTIGSLISQQYLLRTLRTDMSKYQEQIATGKKASTFSGLTATESVNSMTFRQNLNEVDKYIQNINIALTRTSVMNEAMVDITDYARDVTTQLRAQMQDTEPNAQILIDSALTALDQVKQRMNAKLGDRYLFAGTDIANAPLVAGGTNLDTNFSTLVSGWLAGTVTAAQVVTDSRAITNDQLDISAGTLAAGAVTVRTDEEVNIDYSVYAYDAGFQDVLRGLAIISNLQQPTTDAEQDNFWNIVNGAIELIDSGTESIDQQIAVLGNKSSIMSNTKAEHTDFQGTLETFIGEEEDVDMAEATMYFQQIQTQLQASYTVTAEIRQLSLVFYL